jgi:uncharacterized membrane protein YkoI
MKIRSAVITAACAALIASTSGAFAYSGEQYAKEANITLDQARATVAKVRPGQITDQELEKERGGSRLRYSFDVKSKGKTYEVGVDAKSGKVLENKAEGPNPD